MTTERLMGLTETMADVERHAARWLHVHQSFHHKRTNRMCPWCVVRGSPGEGMSK